MSLNLNIFAVAAIFRRVVVFLPTKYQHFLAHQVYKLLNDLYQYGINIKKNPEYSKEWIYDSYYPF